MARRRLTLPAQDAASDRDPASAAAAPGVRDLGRDAGGPPIARAAAEAAFAGAEAARDARRLAEAEAQGRLLLDIPLEAVEDAHLPRDRAPGQVEDEEFQALVQSLRAHGQRTPAEVAPLGGGRYGLISGWRRLGALRALQAETGDPRFGALRALVRGGLGGRADPAAFVAMVEENEIRVGLSPYERGRIAVLAANEGAFADVEAAVERLFAAASKAKRSKIRSFAQLHLALGDALRWPAAIPERLGLRAVEALRALPDAASRLRRGVSLADPARGAEGELAALTAEVETILRIASGGGGAPRAERGGRPARRKVGLERLAPGLQLAEFEEGSRVVFELSGPRAAEAGVREKARKLLRELRELGAG